MVSFRRLAFLALCVALVGVGMIADLSPPGKLQPDQPVLLCSKAPTVAPEIAVAPAPAIAVHEEVQRVDMEGQIRADQVALGDTRDVADKNEKRWRAWNC